MFSGSSHGSEAVNKFPVGARHGVPLPEFSMVYVSQDDAPTDFFTASKQRVVRIHPHPRPLSRTAGEGCRRRGEAPIQQPLGSPADMHDQADDEEDHEEKEQ